MFYIGVLAYILGLMILTFLFSPIFLTFSINELLRMANPWLVPCRKDDHLTTWDATGFPSPGRILHGNKLTQKREHLGEVVGVLQKTSVISWKI